MNKIKITLPYLEGLTTRELYELAENFKVNIAPEYDRNSLIKELLELVPCLNLYQRDVTGPKPEPPPPRVKTPVELPDPAPLPKQYNMTYIDVLVRDPFWIFVIWELNVQDKKRYEKTAGFEGFILRVRVTECNQCERNEVLRIAGISDRDTERYLNFPQRLDCDKDCSVKNCSFVVELCSLIRETVQPIVISRPFVLPPSINQIYPLEAEEPPSRIQLLSGLEEIKVVRGAL